MAYHNDEIALRLPSGVGFSARQFFDIFFSRQATIPSSLSSTTPQSTQSQDKMGSDKIEKKRKRASDRHERPSKKTALDPRELPPLAVSVLKDDSELAPVISMSFL